MLYEILVLILPLLTSPYISRIIGAEGLGIFSFANSIAYYFVLFSMLGINNYGCRVIAQVRDDVERLGEVFWQLNVLHILLSTVFCIAYIVYVTLISEEKLYSSIMFIYVLSGLFDISWFYFGIENFRSIVARNIVTKVLTVVCIFIFVRRGSDLWKYCLIMAAGNLVSQLFLWFPLKKYIHFAKPSFQDMIIHMRPLLILFVPVIAISLYTFMDKIMIGAMSGKAQLGFYENAERVTSIVTTIISSFGVVMLPKMSNMAAGGDHDGMKRYIYMSMKYVMCLGFALAFGIASIGKPFATWFWGRGFAESGNLIMGLAITIPFIAFANVIRTQYLIPNGKDREYMSSVIAGAGINLIINALLIPKYGARGATIGTVAAEATVCVVQVFTVRKEIDVGSLARQSMPFFFIGIGMFALVYGLGKMLKDNIWMLLLRILVGALLYCIVCWGYFIRVSDTFIISFVRNIVKRIKDFGMLGTK